MSKIKLGAYNTLTVLKIALREGNGEPFGLFLDGEPDGEILMPQKYVPEGTEIGDEIEISEYQSFMNYSYIIEPAVAMSGCYPNAQRIKSRKGIVKNIEHTPRGFIVTAEFDE